MFMISPDRSRAKKNITAHDTLHARLRARADAAGWEARSHWPPAKLNLDPIGAGAHWVKEALSKADFFIGLRVRAAAIQS
jgi:hypothetical protein